MAKSKIGQSQKLRNGGRNIMAKFVAASPQAAPEAPPARTLYSERDYFLVGLRVRHVFPFGLFLEG